MTTNACTDVAIPMLRSRLLISIFDCESEAHASIAAVVGGAFSLVRAHQTPVGVLLSRRGASCVASSGSTSREEWPTVYVSIGASWPNRAVNLYSTCHDCTADAVGVAGVIS